MPDPNYVAPSCSTLSSVWGPQRSPSWCWEAVLSLITKCMASPVFLGQSSGVNLDRYRVQTHYQWRCARWLGHHPSSCCCLLSVWHWTLHFGGGEGHRGRPELHESIPPLSCPWSQFPVVGSSLSIIAMLLHSWYIVTTIAVDVIKTAACVAPLQGHMLCLRPALFPLRNGCASSWQPLSHQPLGLCCPNLWNLSYSQTAAILSILISKTISAVFEGNLLKLCF